MSEINRATVTMWAADGSAIKAFESFSIRDTYTDPIGSADFVCRPPRSRVAEYKRILAKGSEVEVLVNHVSIGKFLVASCNRSVDMGGVTFRVHCTSLLGPAYEASVDPDISKHYATDAPITTVVLEALSPFGFDKIVGDTAASRAAISGKPIGGASAPIVVTALKHKDAQAQDGESAYEFCNRIFRRLGVCLRTNHLGELLLGAPDYEQSPIYTLSLDFSGTTPGDRMLSCEIADTNEGQFSECTVRGVQPDSEGQKQASRPGATVTSFSLNPLRPSYTSERFPSKPKIITDKNSRDVKRCTSAAKRVLGMAAKDAFCVSCEVDGLVSRGGFIWTVDTIASVYIEPDGLRENLWVLERELAMDASGQRTRLKLLPKNALILGDAPS